jgi:peptidyl-tRNA hydrolase, PTH2 family
MLASHDRRCKGNQVMKHTMIDPPGGWQWGFPKPIPQDQLGRTREWLVENGYPQSEIDALGEHFYYRFWETEVQPELEHKQVIVMRKDLKCRKGKLIAQGAHASLGAILSLCQQDGNRLILEMDDRTRPWLTGRFKKICVYVNSEAELLEVHEQAKAAGLITSLIKDAGLTEFNGVATLTCCGIGPDRADKIDAVTGQLPLF